MNKKPLLAFILAFVPGLGHLYLDKKVRFALYGGGFLIPLCVSVTLAFVTYDSTFLIIGFVSFLVWGVNMLDMIVTLLRSDVTRSVDTERVEYEGQIPSENERIFTIVLAFLPGLGHLQLGLMMRGLTLMIAFFGLTMMVLFVTVLADVGGFLVFLGVLPIIWIYSFFDVLQQLSRKQRGEKLIDRTVFEDFAENRVSGKKSRMVATLLAVFPGAGHMYLGAQQRGLQLMAGFLFSIYILDVLRLTIFLFLIPIIWFYSFFDTLQHVSKYGDGQLTDRPIVNTFINNQKWVGLGLLAIGAYYLLDNVFVPVFRGFLLEAFEIDIHFWFNEYFQTIIVSIVLIGGGLKLMFGSKAKRQGSALKESAKSE